MVCGDADTVKVSGPNSRVEGERIEGASYSRRARP
jgi:hypothetical protein